MNYVNTLINNIEEFKESMLIENTNQNNINGLNVRDSKNSVKTQKPGINKNGCKC